jgi:CHAD domain-containing protein
MHKALKKTPSMIAKLLRQNGTDPGNSIIANAAASAVRFSSQLALPGRLTRKNLHPYRLKVKELRNILRRADGPSRPRFVDDLRKVKDAIGECTTGRNSQKLRR